MTNKLLILNTPDGYQEISPNTLILFVDETGTPNLKDPKAPYFGLGGLIVLGKDYYNDVEIPWHRLKNNYFDGTTKPLHASDINPSKLQIESLNNFFQTQNFGRFGITITHKSIIEIERPIEELITGIFWETLKNVINEFKWNDLLVIFEENQGLFGAIQQQIMSKKLLNNNQEKITVNYYTMLKDPTLAGLEVADFVIHTAGRQCRIMKDNHYEKDFNKIELLPDFKEVFSSNKRIGYLSVSGIRI